MMPRLNVRHLKISSQNILLALPTYGQNKWFLFLFFHGTPVGVLGKLPEGEKITRKGEDGKGMILLLGRT